MKIFITMKDKKKNMLKANLLCEDIFLNKESEPIGQRLKDELERQIQRADYSRAKIFAKILNDTSKLSDEQIIPFLKAEMMNKGLSWTSRIILGNILDFAEGKRK